jgi:hypothetical protein
MIDFHKFQGQRIGQRGTSDGFMWILWIFRVSVSAINSFAVQIRDMWHEMAISIMNVFKGSEVGLLWRVFTSSRKTASGLSRPARPAKRRSCGEQKAGSAARRLENGVNLMIGSFSTAPTPCRPPRKVSFLPFASDRRQNQVRAWRAWDRDFLRCCTAL